MLGAPSLSLKIRLSTRVIALSCYIRRFSLITTPPISVPRSQLQEESVPQNLAVNPSSAPGDLHNTEIVDSEINEERNIKEEAKKGSVIVIGRHHRPSIKPIQHSHTRITAGGRGQLLHILATTQSSEDAWNAYHRLSTLPVDPTREKYVIPHVYSHRLARLLASTKPRTRTLFLRLLSVLAAVKRDGGTLQVWEWNALIDCAGKGWRKTRQADYRSALNIYQDMLSQSEAAQLSRDDSGTDEEDLTTAVATPDIVTYTTLLYIAARTLMPATLRHASALLNSSGIPPNRITHLSVLRYFTRTGQLSGVRSTITRMREQGLELGIDGINACMTAFMRNARVDVASTIYRVLRHHIKPEHSVGEHDIDAAIHYLDVVEGIVVAEDIVPDRISYTIMIQGFAYHGDLIQALHVFTDMLSSPDLEPLAPQTIGENGESLPPNYPTTLPVFRAIFLGFARHAQPPLPKNGPSFAARLKNLADPSAGESRWTLWHLSCLFKSFLELPVEPRPSERTIYWILVAFAKTTGNDKGKLRKVWMQLENKFGGRWGGRLQRFKQKIFSDIPITDL